MRTINVIEPSRMLCTQKILYSILQNHKKSAQKIKNQKFEKIRKSQKNDF